MTEGMSGSTRIIIYVYEREREKSTFGIVVEHLWPPSSRQWSQKWSHEVVCACALWRWLFHWSTSLFSLIQTRSWEEFLEGQDFEAPTCESVYYETSSKITNWLVFNREHMVGLSKCLWSRSKLDTVVLSTKWSLSTRTLTLTEMAFT